LPRLKTKTSVIKPIHHHTKPNRALDLGSETVAFEYKGKKHKATAAVSLRFLPKAKLVFRVAWPKSKPFLGWDLLSEENGNHHLIFPQRRVSVNVLTSGHGDNWFECVPKTSVVTMTTAKRRLYRAVLHLFNIPNFYGPESYIITKGRGRFPEGTLCGRSTLQADDWHITIAATDRTSSLCKTLGEEGGFAMTHVAEVVKSDGAAFSSKLLENLIQALHHFLSFSFGRWVGVALPIGYSRTGQTVWEQWGFPVVNQGKWSASFSWFDEYHGEFLSDAFPGFWKMWTDEVWQKSLSNAIYWYIGANGEGRTISTDKGLVQAQIALELLAWTYCVQDRKMLSAAAFNKPGCLPAADKLRVLASSLGVPLEIPSKLRALRSKRGTKWADAMDAITGIRNTAVHPNKKEQIRHERGYEAWNLAQWYLEMILLKLFAYKGQYANRLVSRWAGQVEPVPWAKGGAEK